MSEPIYQQANILPPQAAAGIPPEVAQQAEIQALGPFVRAFVPTNIWLVLAITVGAIILDIILNYVIWLAGWIVYYLWLVPILIIIYAVNAIRTSNHKAFLYQEGFVYTSGSQLNVIRWDRVEAVWMKIVRTSRYNSSTRNTYTIKSPDGSQVVISSHLKKVKELGEVIMNEVTRRHLPLARQAYASGVPVSFGDLSVSLQGIGFRDKFLPWPEVKDVNLVNGTVQVKKQGSMLAWASVDVAKVSNLPVLLQLVTDGLRAQPQVR